MIGTTLSHFKITDKLGEGGMGQVYRAQDTKLGREVALKVLPEEFTQDPERMARFEREAKVLAALDHSNIAAIYGLEEVEGRQLLIMQVAEGETLAERIAREPFPIAEALPIAVQIAQALEAAHEKGIIHRDLKPANVKLNSAGQVKVLDFGLAKALAGDPASSDSQPDLTQSPTLTAHMTAVGMLMGTAAYMSPEQARGQRADKRADVWAFGCLLYEMLSGRKTFPGDTATDVLGGIVHKEPEWDALPADTPQPVRRLLRRCLRKDPSRRLHDVADARISIQDFLEDPAAAETSAEAVQPPTWKRALPWAVAGVALLVAAVVIPAVSRTSSGSGAPLRLQVAVSKDDLAISLGSGAVLSPDGAQLVYVAGDDSGQTLYLRPLDRLEGTRLAAGSGTANPYHPFFSPDGQWVGFVNSVEMKKVPVTGGTPIKLCDVNRSRGASWGPDDTIVFAPTPASGLFRMSAAGGEPEPLVTLDQEKDEATHRWPQHLPGGKAVIFTSHSQTTGRFDDATIEALVLATGERKVLHRGGYHGRYIPSGHLVYVNDGTLFAMPFDPDRLEVTGAPAPAVQGLAVNPVEGGAQYSFSETGTLAYISGEGAVSEYPILWVDRSGSISSLWQEQAAYASPRLSADGTRLALSVLREEDNWDVWIYDLERGVATRLTFHEGYDGDQVWSPDGQHLIFASDRDGLIDLYRKRADGSGEVERLTEAATPVFATAWSSDGRFVVGTTIDQGYDLWVMPLDEEGGPEPFLATSFTEHNGTFSPDGRWIAYESNESGRVEIYVRPFPAAGGKWQVSDGGGAEPRWARGGRELIYRGETGLMVVSVDTAGGTFRAGKPQRLFQGPFRGGLGGLSVGGNVFPDYDITPDGQRFVMFPQEAEEGRGGHVTLVTRWFDELRRNL
jgi:serine/threonine protein kinase/Tol biopolymer transport system component